jgi:hypothetical protein
VHPIWLTALACKRRKALTPMFVYGMFSSAVTVVASASALIVGCSRRRPWPEAAQVVQQAFRLDVVERVLPNAARIINRSSMSTLLFASRSVWAHRPWFDVHVWPNAARTLSKSSILTLPFLSTSTLQYFVHVLVLHVRQSTDVLAQPVSAVFNIYPARHDWHIEEPFFVQAAPVLGVPLMHLHRCRTHLRDLSV